MAMVFTLPDVKYTHDPLTGFRTGSAYIIFAITYAKLNGLIIDNSSVDIPDPMHTVVKSKDKHTLTFKKAPYYITFDWDIQVCASPTVQPEFWRAKVGNETVKRFIKSSKLVVPGEIDKVDTLQLVPFPNYDEFAARTLSHEWQHYQDHKYLANLIFYPWNNYVEWMSGINDGVEKGFEMKDSGSKYWLLAGGEYARNTINLIKAYHNGVNQSGQMFHETHLGSFPTFSLNSVTETTLLVNVAGVHPTTNPTTPHEWFTIHPPRNVQNIKRGACEGVISGRSPAEVFPDKHAAFVPSLPKPVKDGTSLQEYEG